MDRKEFFLAVARLTGREEEYTPPSLYVRRWKRSRSGEGLYENFGVIRWFSSRLIHIALEGPVIKTFESPEEALKFLEELLV